ncbi:MAG: helix-turn-helix domain-containing protein [Sphingomonadales bacterium]|nr:MAG: helix-turn-helix domain-containing protein [Sphingomonadales bacterium]
MMNLASQEFDICTHAERPDGTRAAYVRNSGSNVLTVDFGSPVPLPDGTSDLFAFLDEFDDDPVIAELLPDARKEVGQSFETQEGLTIRVLRMRMGMSQADLARALNTSQPAISAIENRARKPGEDNIRDLARVLKVDFNTLMEALGNV